MFFFFFFTPYSNICHKTSAGHIHLQICRLSGDGHGLGQDHDQPDLHHGGHTRLYGSRGEISGPKNQRFVAVFEKMRTSTPVFFDKKTKKRKKTNIQMFKHTWGFRVLFFILFSRLTRDDHFLCPLKARRQVIDQTGHTKSVDWWTLGVLLFELLAGEPFQPPKNVKLQLLPEKLWLDLIFLWIARYEEDSPLKIVSSNLRPCHTLGWIELHGEVMVMTCCAIAAATGLKEGSLANSWFECISSQCALLQWLPADCCAWRRQFGQRSLPAVLFLVLFCLQQKSKTQRGIKMIVGLWQLLWRGIK